jgi:uncharacterized protein (TIGR03083 family)
VNREQLLNRLDTAWAAFQASYTGLSSAQLAEPGVVEHWSVKDLIAHVSWWEEEALQHLPLVRAGGRPPRYSVRYGGIDAFNALKCEQARALSLADVLSQFEATHRRLVAYLQTVPEDEFTRETRFRRRLRLDTYSHYPIHTEQIRQWRQRRGN